MSNNTTSSYSTHRDGEFTVFTVTPGHHPLADGIPFLKPGGVFKLAKSLLGQPQTPDEPSKGSKMTLGAQQPYYREAVIRVKPGLLELPGDLRHLYGRESITAQELHRLTTKNYVIEDLGYGRVYTSNNNAFNAGRDMRMAMAKAIGWAVDAEAGGRAFILSFGLNEVTANGLMHDLHRILNG